MSISGYIPDQPWRYLYHQSLNPHFIRFVMAMAGWQMPAIKSFCELAYGQGLSLAIHAACNQHIAWIGTDFNSQHAEFAKRLCSEAQLTNLRLHNQSFADFCQRTDIGSADAVGMIGTWSWLPPTDQAVVTHFLSR